MSEPKTALLQIRITPADRDRLVAEANALGLKTTDLARQRIFAPNPPVISPREVERGPEVPDARVVVEDPGPVDPSAVPGFRACSACHRVIGSPTMRYCHCGGKIQPPPKGSK